MNVGDIDIFEVNEALQSFPCLMDHLKVDLIVNVNGGNYNGSSLGATGCMILGTALDEWNVKIKVQLWLRLCGRRNVANYY
jgi:acetyl-CoA C-acetyltransferase